jgi:hypothetical protein
MTPTFIGPLSYEDPLEVDDARRASHALAVQRREAEKVLKELTDEAADKERLYRKRLAEAFVDVKGKTAAEKEANARADASDASYERDLAAGMVKVQEQRLKGLEGERSQLKTLMDWSSRMRLDENQQARS